MGRLLRWGLFLVYLVGVAGSVILVVTRFQSDARAALHSTAMMTVQSLEDRFFRKQSEELAWLSLQPEVREFLEAGTGSAQNVLRYSAGILDHDMVFLFDRHGRIVASTRPETVGAAVGFRPYVNAALQGGVSFYVAKGVSTLSRGIYLAMPVYSHGTIQGGVAFRLSGRQLDSDLRTRGPTLFVTAEGIVFSSSRAQEIFRTLVPLSIETLKRLEASRQFPGVSFTALPWTWLSENRVMRDGETYLVEQVALPSLAGDRILVLTPETFPWGTVTLTLVVAILALGGVLLIARQVRLVRERQEVDRERLHATQLLQSTLEGMALIDGQGALIWTNPEFLRVLGAHPSSALPLLGQLWDPSTPAGVETVLLGDSARATGEAVVRGLQGTWVPVAFGFSRFGRDYLLGVLDLSEHVRSEALIHRSQRLSALGQLAGGVAHDLNNILGVLIGMTEILRDSVKPENPERESLDLMSVTLGRATTLAEKLLDFARQSPVERKPVDLGTLLRELKFLAEMTLPATVEAKFQVPAQRLRVLGDVGLLQSALLNLVVNASDAMADGGHLQVSVEADGPHHARILVTDDGPGMSPEILKRVFEPFFTTKGPQKGTGLGLSLVRRTVLEHRGTIDLKSEVGKGTEVHIRLPVIADPTPE